MSEGLLVAVATARTGGFVLRGSAASTEVASGACCAFFSLVLGDLARRPAKAWRDLVGDDLDDRALLAFLGLPRTLLEAARDDHPGALADRRADVLAELTPARDVEERRVLLPLPVALEPAVDGDADRGDGLPGIGEPQLGVARDVADDGDGVVCHVRTSSWLSRP